MDWINQIIFIQAWIKMAKPKWNKMTKISRNFRTEMLIKKMPNIMRNSTKIKNLSNKNQLKINCHFPTLTKRTSIKMRSSVSMIRFTLKIWVMKRNISHSAFSLTMKFKKNCKNTEKSTSSTWAVLVLQKGDILIL